MGGISLKPEDFGEGGNIPGPNKAYRVKEAVVVVGRFIKGARMERVPWSTPNTKEQPVAVGLDVVFQDDEGVEYGTQFYSAGDPARLVPSEDGKKPNDTGNCLIANPSFDGNANLTRSCSLAILIAEAVNAGYPENKVGDNLTEMFEGLKAYWVAKKKTQVEGSAASRDMLIPQGDMELPGEGKSAKAKKAEKSGEEDEEATDRALKKLVKIVKAELVDKKELSRAELSQTVMSDYDDDEDCKLMAQLIFQKEFKKALGKKGFELEGETIKAEED